jgi:hypothetical protein
MDVHEDRGDLKKGKKRSVTRSTSMNSPIKQDAVYLNNKWKNGLRNIIYRNNKSVWKVENEAVDKLLNVFINKRMDLCTESCITHISSRTQVNKSNENHYPADDAEIVADDKSIPAQSKLRHIL